jgi:hypothetical protein
MAGNMLAGCGAAAASNSRFVCIFSYVYLIDLPDEGQMPILMCAVDTITNDKNVWDCEADEINLNGHFPTARLVHQGARKNARCALVAEEVARLKKGPPTIHDIVDEQHSAAGQVDLELADQAHMA